MAEDDILFHRGEGKVPVGVAQGGEGMAEAVEPVGRIGVMPVIEEIIVKQRAAHQFRRKDKGSRLAARQQK